MPCHSLLYNVVSLSKQFSNTLSVWLWRKEHSHSVRFKSEWKYLETVLNWVKNILGYLVIYIIFRCFQPILWDVVELFMFEWIRYLRFLVSTRWRYTLYGPWLSHHFARNVSSGCLISLHENVVWLPHSPNLNSCSFFIWEYPFKLLFKQRHRTLEELEETTREEITGIPHDMLARVKTFENDSISASLVKATWVV